MKRIGAIFMAAVMMILCSCGNHGTGQDRGSTDNNGQAETRLEERDVTEGLGEDDTENPAAASLPEEFVLVQGGTFQMGSPEEEAWRSEDEVLHTVTVSDFYMSAYELTQAEYQEITGENPSSFSGEDLPVENISWLDAVSYCNTRSEREGLTPAYTVEGSDVIWDRGADGCRLPTEAEWEYACRAGTTTPFNTETSISAEEANYYGHYPYEIEGNYFSQENLTTKPGQYRQTTVAVNSFSLMHGDFTICTAMWANGYGTIIGTTVQMR